ncbi:MAG: hypothetical protein K6T72_16865 [Anoxybacillus sp.]|nr:hypothetical protein [Anoxybacillus sp.]MCL6588136.1 hypothetical protein [Anoxybacillus sp.]
MSFWSSLSKLGHFVEKKVEQTVKHVANDVKKVEKTIQQTVQQAEKKVEPVVKQVVKDTVHISQQAKEAFHQAEKKAEQMGKHIAHEVKQAEKAVQKIEKKMEHVAKQAVKDTVHISEKAQKAFYEAEKKAEQAVKHIVHDGKKMVFGTVHSIRQKIKQEIQETEKTIERDVHQLEKKAEHAAKQAVHGIIHTGKKIEQIAGEVAKNAEKSWHGFIKHPMESTVEFVRGAGDAVVQDITLDNIHRSYHSPHPVAYESGEMAGHVVSTMVGMIETSGAEALEVDGAALTATGEGAFVGVPAMAMAGEGMAYGQAETSFSFHRLVKSAEELYQRMSRSEGVSGKVANGTDEAEKLAKGTKKTRPSWRQSEIDVGKEYPSYREQVSFKDGNEVSHGTKNSSRPDFYINGHSIEVKNYKVTTSSGRSNLIRNVSHQINKRISDLPEQTRQTVIIDVRGQNVTRDVLRDIKQKINEGTNGVAEIIFKMD